MNAQNEKIQSEGSLFLYFILSNHSLSPSLFSSVLKVLLIIPWLILLLYWCIEQDETSLLNPLLLLRVINTIYRNVYYYFGA